VYHVGISRETQSEADCFSAIGVNAVCKSVIFRVIAAMLAGKADYGESCKSSD
jgi:hypothetical protein